ncbi:MAG: hypothetical protein K2N27_12000 [Ruminococcus sp.]|nr:hypothetical protein [Ruminococcus sp.]
MNFMKKSVAVLCMMMLTGCGDVATQSSAKTETTVSDDEIYSGIVESLENMSMESEYPCVIDSDRTERIISIINEKRPELFWITGFTTTSYPKKTTIEIDVLNGYKPTELETMYHDIVASADELISSIPSHLDTYGTVVFVHDYIVSNCEYYMEGADSGTFGLWSNAYGCLVNGRAVCQGYAEAFQYIMNRLDIECGICKGDTKRGRHAWNYVNIDGKYYWIDLTWDDPVSEYGEIGEITHTYCLIDDNRLMRTRTIDSNCNFIPKCNEMHENYFVKNGTYLTSYSDITVTEILNRYADRGQAEIMFSDVSVYNDAIENLFENGGIWGLTDSEQINYSEDDTMLILTIRY